MNLHDAYRFADTWASAWNAHDLDRVLALFADDVVFRSPVAARLLGTDGTVRGAEALRAYWAQALTHRPNLRFEVLSVYAGVDTVVIRFRQDNGSESCEVLTFTDGVVTAGEGTHGRPS